MMVIKLSYRAQKSNSRLTDFDDLKDYIISNSVKKLPRTIKTRPEHGNTLLSTF
jgi:hypothetical protein